MRLFASALSIALTAGLPAWAECPMDLGGGTGWVVFSQHFMIAFRPDPLRLRGGERAAFILNVCTKDNEAAELIEVNVLPVENVQAPHQRLEVSGGEQGRYRVDGLLLSGPGHWEIDFEVRSGEASEQLSHEIVVQ